MKLSTAKRFGLKLSAIFLVLMSALYAFGASGDVDAGFNPQLTIAGNFPAAPAIQPDGKIIVLGSYQLPGFSYRPYIKRLNADGSIDPTFNCPECLSFFPKGIAFQPDGKIMVSGTTEVASGTGRLIRVNQNGNLDTSFKTPITATIACRPKQIVVQPDGKSLVSCVDSPNGSTQDSVRRINNDGSLDTTFAAILLSTNSPRPYINQMVSLPDSKVLIGGGFDLSGSGWLNRYNANGTIDNSFQVTVNGRIVGIELLTDGKYLIAGSFSSVNGTSRSKIARLFSDGSLDTSFTAPTASNEVITGLKLLSNGQFYIRLYTDPVPLPGDFIGRFVRYNANGSVDNTFSQTFLHPEGWAVDNLNRIVVFKSRDAGRFYRLNTDGNIDANFNPLISVDGLCTTAALQSDGKVVIAGEFQKTNGTDTVRFTRVNSDGTTDATFNSGSGFDVAPTTLAIQPDGKILASGNFTVYNGTPRTKLVRINADGSLDALFSPNINSNVYAIAPLATGKILIGGIFTTVNGTNQGAFARLNADGSLDAAFHPGFGNSTVFTILVQADGKIMVGGFVSGIGSLVRLNSDGGLDGSFDESGVSNVGQVLQLPDGKYIVYTKNIGGNDPSRIVRLHNHGPTDFSFYATLGSGTTVNTIFLQPNGSVVFGGKFDSVNGRESRNIGRVGPSGQSDIYFPTFGANDSVNTILGQPDGKIIVVGNFSGIEDVGRSGIARLTLSNRTRGTLFDYDGDGRADVSIFRPSTNYWYELLSSNGSVSFQNFGASGDIIAPADYDGDGKTDLGLFRPSTGGWLYLSSINNTVTQFQWGQAGDIPLPSDVTGDGKAEFIVYRPTTGTWFRSGGGHVVFGVPNTDKPLIGDFDGDGKNDPAIFRPSTGVWWYWASSAGGQHRAYPWGASTDIPAPGDYDGDGKTDYAVYRPSEGTWYIYRSTEGAYAVGWGVAEDLPVPADYDGDGKTDIAVFRPSTGVWYLLQTTAGFGAIQWGVATDIPTENAFIP